VKSVGAMSEKILLQV